MTASPLTDAEYNHLSSVLNRFRDDHAMNLMIFTEVLQRRALRGERS
jgi:hypothetical protein